MTRRIAYVFCILAACLVAACGTTQPPRAGAHARFGDAARYSQSFARYSGHVEEIPTQQVRVLTLDLTRDPNDIWDRIRRGFAMPDIATERVDHQQLSYLSHPNTLRTVFERGGRYLYYIVAEIERRGLPTELAQTPLMLSIMTLAYRPQMATMRPRTAAMPARDESRSGDIITMELGMVETDIVTIPPHTLFAGNGGSGPAPEELLPGSVLNRIVVPKKITVHLGKPSANVRNVTVSFQSYIANVASSEVYPTWDSAPGTRRTSI